MAEFLLRPIVDADAEEVGTAHVRIWQQTYASMMDQVKLAALVPQDRIPRWRDQIIPGLAAREAAGESITRCAVHQQTGHIAGFGTGGQPRDDDPPRTTELWSLNVLPEFHGTGAASQLMAALIGDRPAYLWVATPNVRAIAFYRKHGFELDGTTQYDETWACHESRMVRG